jgi:hypothetical protein
VTLLLRNWKPLLCALALILILILILILAVVGGWMANG